MDVDVYDRRQEDGLPGLRHSASIGVKWSFVSNIGRQSVQFISAAVLARLLTPMDFGLVGMAMIAVGFVGLFKDLGTASAVVQARNPSEEMLSSIFWANIGIGVVATIGLFLIAPVMGVIFHEPRIVLMLKVLAFTLLISSFSTVHQALLQRRLSFQTIATTEVAAIAAGAPVGIGLAYSGAGSWSLVFQAKLILL